MTAIQSHSPPDTPPTPSYPEPHSLPLSWQQPDQSAKVYCWPSFFSPSDELEPEPLPSRSAAIFL